MEMTSTQDRSVASNQVVYGQVDFFQVDGFTRVTGLTPSGVLVNTFFNNLPQPWAVVNGLGVMDAQITSGYIYFNEVPGSPGYYNIRWRPNAVGFWRIITTYVPGQQIEIQNFDIFAAPSPIDSGLSASFIKPDC